MLNNQDQVQEIFALPVGLKPLARLDGKLIYGSERLNTAFLKAIAKSNRTSPHLAKFSEMINYKKLVVCFKSKTVPGFIQWKIFTPSREQNILGFYDPPSDKIFIFIALLLICLVIGCASAKKEELTGAEFYFQRGISNMEKKQYIKALTDFQTVVDSYAGSELVDKAQFMLAEAHFMNEDYLTAAFEYNRVYTEYPSSTHTVEARYKRALCFYHESPKAVLDQENTLLAIDEFNRYIDELNSKLAYKDYENAELYRKLKKYESALEYYGFVIKNYPRTIWAHESRYGMGLVYIKQGSYEKAKETLQYLVDTNVSKDLKNKASKRLSYIEKKLTGK